MKHYNRNENKAISIFQNSPNIEIKEQKWEFEDQQSVSDPRNFTSLKSLSIPKRFLHEFGGLNTHTKEIFKSYYIEIHKILKNFLKEKFNIFDYNLNDYEVNNFQILYNIHLIDQIKKLPNIKNILEIGPGSGWQSILFKKMENLNSYSQIEVSPKLYELQNFINNCCYYRNYIDLSEFSPSESIEIRQKGENFLIHYPWWHIKSAFKVQKYDLIMMNECMMEMSFDNFRYYAKHSSFALSDHGFLMIFGYGNTSIHSNIVERLDYILDCGFKILINVNPKAGFHHHKLLFIKETSPYVEFRARDAEIFLARVNFVRNLIKPRDGEIISEKLLSKVIAETHKEQAG